MPEFTTCAYAAMKISDNAKNCQWIREGINRATSSWTSQYKPHKAISSGRMKNRQHAVPWTSMANVEQLKLVASVGPFDDSMEALAKAKRSIDEIPHLPMPHGAEKKGTQCTRPTTNESLYSTIN